VRWLEDAMALLRRLLVAPADQEWSCSQMIRGGVFAWLLALVRTTDWQRHGWNELLWMNARTAAGLLQQLVVLLHPRLDLDPVTQAHLLD